MTRRHLTAVALAVACSAAVTSTAQAAAKNPVYDVRIKGSEAITWEYNPRADGQCFQGGTGFGSQHVRYDTGKVRLVGVKPSADPQGGLHVGLLQLVEPKQADIFEATGFSDGFDAKVSVEREGEIHTSATCGGTGGGQQEPPPQDCGVRQGTLVLHAGFHRLRTFLVEGTYGHFGPAGSPAPGVGNGDALGLTYENCPWILPPDMSAARDEITPLTRGMSAKRLPKKGKTVKFSIGDHIDYEEDDRKGDLTYATNITIKRIK